MSELTQDAPETNRQVPGASSPTGFATVPHAGCPARSHRREAALVPGLCGPVLWGSQMWALSGELGGKSQLTEEGNMADVGGIGL